jgi:transposase-like protein
MSSPHTRPKLNFEGDGWVAYTPPGQRFAVRLHVSHKPGPGRWVVDEVRFADFRVTARMLRDLPLGQIEVWINQLVQHDLADPASRGPRLASVRFERSDALTLIEKLEDPGGHPKPDEFYRRVAEIYGLAAAASTRPAAELAEAWEVPVTTVHRWVRVARSRGHLPPGESGRRG